MRASEASYTARVGQLRARGVLGMRGSTSCGTGWRRAKLAIVIGVALCVAAALVACGGSSAQSTASSAASPASSSAASSSATTSSASSSAASQGSAALPIPEAYVETKAAVSFSDGSSATDASVYDERGRLQRGSFEEVSPEAASKVDQSFSEWDEYGHVLKGEYGYDPGDGKPYTASTSLQVLEANEDGSVVSDQHVRQGELRRGRRRLGDVDRHLRVRRRRSGHSEA